MKRIGLIALSCLTLGALTSAAPGPDATTTYKGFISDKQCGATIDADCNKRCFERGETPVLVIDGTGAILDIANAERVIDLPGAHVEIKGTIDPKEKKLIVAEVRAL